MCLTPPAVAETLVVVGRNRPGRGSGTTASPVVWRLTPALAVETTQLVGSDYLLDDRGHARAVAVALSIHNSSAVYVYMAAGDDGASSEASRFIRVDGSTRVWTRSVKCHACEGANE
jgi:hypothetical protein